MDDDEIDRMLRGDGETADYSSAAGWGTSTVAALIEKDKKRNPRAWAPDPQMLYARTVSDWLNFGRPREAADELFGPFWLRDELAVLFARTGTGKSALATQIADSLSRGVYIAPFGNGTVSTPQRVLYLDFELSADQLAMRYSRFDESSKQFTDPYEFSRHFLRAELYWDGRVIEGYESFSEMFFQNIADQIDDHGATVLIVDNITFLDRASTSNVQTSLSIMRCLSRLKRDGSISILVLAHTPKRRPSAALTERDLQGSINIANFADSIFALGESRRSPDLRYLKQIKVRTGRLEHGPRHVPVFTFGKFDNGAALGLVQNTERPPVENFLGMKFIEFAPEDAHLDIEKRPSQQISRLGKRPSGVREKAKALATEGLSTRRIAQRLGVAPITVSRWRRGK